MYSFSEAELAKRLARTSPWACVAFAAACAERLFPTYSKYIARAGSDDNDALRRMLDTAWAAAAGMPHPRGAELADLIETCMDLIPNSEEGPPAAELPVAEDFGAAVAYSLRCLESEDPQEAAWAARCAYEAMDNVILQRTHIDLNVSGAEERILANQLIQTELGYQEEDLRTLERAIAEASRSVVALLKSRAAERAHMLF
jgi:uncharacterized protein YjaG (DUF416 family)